MWKEGSADSIELYTLLISIVSTSRQTSTTQKLVSEAVERVNSAEVLAMSPCRIKCLMLQLRDELSR
jgi:hypothetical protein